MWSPFVSRTVGEHDVVTELVSVLLEEVVDGSWSQGGTTLTASMLGHV